LFGYGNFYIGVKPEEDAEDVASEYRADPELVFEIIEVPC